MSANLTQYTGALVAAGWDDVEYIRSMDAAQVDEMGDSVQMKPGHVARLKSALNLPQ